ncbi:MAG: HPF/RaiA family ribosome-associated protein [Planctomicrobium sp.]|jgi:putative sigma-54 modulation protein|nr:HPF/RaiA family ribosome-associated protein [Planctomicrobium sp.]
MKLMMTDRSDVLTHDSRLLAERRLLFALSRFDSRIHEVNLVVSDENGPRGGVDKVARITIQLRGASDVVMTHKDDEISKCISRLADRAGRAVARSLKKSHQFDRSRPEVLVQEELEPVLAE